MMSKKNYDLAAQLVRCLPEEDRVVPYLFYSALFMADGNPRYNKHKFRRACGLPDKPSEGEPQASLHEEGESQ